MCNGIGFRLHIRAGGDEVLLHRWSHPIVAEAGGPAELAGAMVNRLDGDGGMFTAEQVEEALWPEDRYMPRSRLVSVEQTTNMGGGRVWPLEQIQAVLDVARRHGMRTHLDGARLLNAVVASGVPAADYASGFDTAWLDFSKGLGAPVGAVLCGSRELIEEAWRWKQMLGGAMRQAGVLAAGCLYALDHHVERLAEDHENARVLADGLRALGLDVLPQETNIVIASVDDPAAVIDALAAEDVRISSAGRGRIRCVTHLDVDRAGVDTALAAFGKVLATACPVRVAPMGTIKGDRSVEIEAPIERVYEIAADIANSAEWQGSLKDVEVLERDAEKRALLVATESDAKVKTVKAVLRFSYDPPTGLRWVQEKGDTKSLVGSWAFEDLGSGRTRATYALEADPGRMLGLLLRGPAETAVRDFLLGNAADGLKEKAEALPVGAAAGSSRLLALDLRALALLRRQLAGRGCERSTRS